MITEMITWFEVAEQLPDDDTTVLYEAPESEEPVWLGYYDDSTWCSAEGVEIEGVVRWAHLPKGGQR